VNSRLIDGGAGSVEVVLDVVVVLDDVLVVDVLVSGVDVLDVDATSAPIVLDTADSGRSEQPTINTQTINPHAAPRIRFNP
jgi:hypothetical protein